MKQSVLIVDDEEGMCELIKTYLKDAHFDFDIFTATNPEEGLKVLHNRPIDLLITDLSMPGGPDQSGVGLIRSLENLSQERKPHFIIVVSGLVKENTDFMTDLHIAQLGKPFKPQELIGLIEKVFTGPAPELVIDEVVLQDFIEEVIPISKTLHEISTNFESNLDNDKLLQEFGSFIFGLSGTAQMLDLNEIGLYFKSVSNLCKVSATKNITKLRTKTRNQISSCLEIIEILIQSLDDSSLLTNISRKLQTSKTSIDRLIQLIEKSV